MVEQRELDVGEVSMSEALAAGVEFPSTKWAGTLAELVDLYTAHYERKGRTLDEAIAEAQTIVLMLAEYNGGRSVYLPRGAALRTALRDRAIYLAAKRGNTQALASRYGLVERRVQQIVAEQHAIHIARTQGSLFGT